MTFEEYIDREFQKNLELAREELIEHWNPDDVECAAWRVATEFTQDDIANYVGSYLGKRWALKQEGINKTFYG